MSYWNGNKKSVQLRKRDKATSEYVDQLLSSPKFADESQVIKYVAKSGPSRKLSLEQELLLVLMKLRLELLTEDLAFRFCISIGKVSQIIIAWILLLSKELEGLIV